MMAFFINTQAQDTLLMKYSYGLEEDYGYPRIIPLSKHAELFSLSHGVEEKMENKQINLIELKKTWRAQRNEVLTFNAISWRGCSTEIDSVFFDMKKRVSNAREMSVYGYYMRRNSFGLGSSAGAEYFANPPPIPDPYPACHALDLFKYRIPILHEIDWVQLPQEEATTQLQDTLIQSRLFLTDSIVITLGEKQWKLLDVKYCFGYHVPDTINNTHFTWETRPIKLPKIVFKKKVNRTIKLLPKKKKKTIKIGKVNYVFSEIQKLYHKDEYLVNCKVTKNKITYTQNLFLGKGSQLLFNNIVLNVLEVNPYDIKIIIFKET
jgi:hypothetical protein